LQLILSNVVLYVETNRKFTLDELGKFDGKEGRPAYVAHKGKVYDVTDSSQWLEGDHLGHAAGEDLTEQMEIAPHGEDVMERMKLVGVLSK
jgi:predicted heme/steroid binding protein